MCLLATYCIVHPKVCAKLTRRHNPSNPTRLTDGTADERLASLPHSCAMAIDSSRGLLQSRHKSLTRPQLHKDASLDIGKLVRTSWFHCHFLLYQIFIRLVWNTEHELFELLDSIRHLVKKLVPHVSHWKNMHLQLPT
jgi:hypothetical protein